MRGHKEYFYRLQKGSSISFLVMSPPYKYSAHYIHDGDKPVSKKNCHGYDCPYCLSGVPVREGLYVIILNDSGDTYYFDITKPIYREMSKSAKDHCQEVGEPFTNMGEFLESHLTTVSKVDTDSTFSGYNVKFTDIDRNDFYAIRKQLSEDKTASGKRYQKMIVDIPDLIRPGTPEEDKEVYYAG